MQGKTHLSAARTDVWFGVFIFYYFCKQMHFLHLLEMDTVFPIHNNISYLSSAFIYLFISVPGFTLLVSTVCFCVMMILFPLCTILPLVYKSTILTVLCFCLLQNGLYPLVVASSILQMHRLSLREAQLSGLVRTASRRRRFKPGSKQVVPSTETQVLQRRRERF